MQVIINKCFFLNPGKIGTNPSSFLRKTKKTHTLIPKNDVTELKTRIL